MRNTRSTTSAKPVIDTVEDLSFIIAGNEEKYLYPTRDAPARICWSNICVDFHVSIKVIEELRTTAYTAPVYQ